MKIDITENAAILTCFGLFLVFMSYMVYLTIAHEAPSKNIVKEMSTNKNYIVNYYDLRIGDTLMLEVNDTMRNVIVIR